VLPRPTDTIRVVASRRSYVGMCAGWALSDDPTFSNDATDRPRGRGEGSGSVPGAGKVGIAHAALQQSAFLLIKARNVGPNRSRTAEPWHPGIRE
jgi:hypothetical protein